MSHPTRFGTEEELVAACLDPVNTDAWSYLSRKYEKRIVRVVRRALGHQFRNQELLYRLVSDYWTRLWKRHLLRKFTLDRGPLEGFLCLIARRFVMRELERDWWTRLRLPLDLMEQLVLAQTEEPAHIVLEEFRNQLAGAELAFFESVLLGGLPATSKVPESVRQRVLRHRVGERWDAIRNR